MDGGVQCFKVEGARDIKAELASIYFNTICLLVIRLISHARQSWSVV